MARRARSPTVCCRGCARNCRLLLSAASAAAWRAQNDCGSSPHCSTALQAPRVRSQSIGQLISATKRAQTAIEGKMAPPDEEVRFRADCACATEHEESLVLAWQAGCRPGCGAHRRSSFGSAVCSAQRSRYANASTPSKPWQRCAALVPTPPPPPLTRHSTLSRSRSTSRSRTAARRATRHSRRRRARRSRG